MGGAIRTDKVSNLIRDELDAIGRKVAAHVTEQQGAMNMDVAVGGIEVKMAVDPLLGVVRVTIRRDAEGKPMQKKHAEVVINLDELPDIPVGTGPVLLNR